MWTADMYVYMWILADVHKLKIKNVSKPCNTEI